MSACITCKGLQNHSRDLEDSAGDLNRLEAIQWVNTTLPSLRGSSKSCRACALLLQGILLHHDRFAGAEEKDVSINAESLPSDSAKTTQDHLSVEMRWPNDSDGCCDGDEHEDVKRYPDLKLEFFTDQDGQSSYLAIGQGRHITDEFLQDAGVQKSRSMIGQCLANHSLCRHVKPHVKPATLPRRVLDVMVDDPAKPVRLHESKFDKDENRYEMGEYLALSYVYGNYQDMTGQDIRYIPRTTTKTLEEHKKGISWTSLPRTFQDAIFLTRSRGFRWLWIDSLCIVQDDPAEKLAEALKMDEIFGNAFVTIAATCAVDTDAGLFPRRTQPFKIQATDSKGSLSKIYVREQPSHLGFKLPFEEGNDMDGYEPITPLISRAWAYGERLLSRRVLHFTNDEMILECREAYQCECGRIDDPTYDSRPTDSVKQEFSRIVAEARNDIETTNVSDERIDSVVSQFGASSLEEFRVKFSQTRANALELWYNIVNNYTRKNLTYETDRLLAIASVAKLLVKPIGSGYVAGLWTYSALGLLWYPNDSSECHRPKQNSSQNVPSWSWASVEGSPISFHDDKGMDLACTVFSAHLRDTIWSPASGDKIKLRAAMATEVTLRVDTEYFLVRNGVNVEFTPDVSPLRGQDALDSGATLFVVLVSINHENSLIGLVLKPSEAEPKLYRRVGCLECDACQVDGSDNVEDGEALLDYWFPEVKDMTLLETGPKQNFTLV